MTDALISAEKRDENGRFIVPPKSPGRPQGARTKLGEAFVQAMHDDFLENGVKAIELARLESPIQYVKVIASLLPKDVNLNVNSEIEMTDDELIERIRQLQSVIGPFLDSGTGAVDRGTPAPEGEGQPPRVH
jgi:hypothetical protein